MPQEGRSKVRSTRVRTSASERLAEAQKRPNRPPEASPLRRVLVAGRTTGPEVVASENILRASRQLWGPDAGTAQRVVVLQQAAKPKVTNCERRRITARLRNEPEPCASAWLAQVRFARPQLPVGCPPLTRLDS